MISKLMDTLFGCRHSRYSFPITVRGGSQRSSSAQRTGTYVACLDCGREFRYDWQEMRITGSQKTASLMSGAQAREAARALVTKEAA